MATPVAVSMWAGEVVVGGKGAEGFGFGWLGIVASWCWASGGGTPKRAVQSNDSDTAVALLSSVGLFRAV